MNIKNKILNHYKLLHGRTKNAVIHIFYSFFLKAFSILIQLAMIPITIDYLDQYQFGIWLTLASIFGWFSFFDVGLGNGLRNKLAVAMAKNDIELSKTYVSTTYAILSFIFISLILIFYFVSPLLNWGSILNIPTQLGLSINKLAFFVFMFFGLRFIFNLIGNILFSDQKPAINNLIGPLGNFIALICIIILKQNIPGSLFNVGMIFSGVPLLVVIIFNIYLFRTRYKHIAPSYKYIKLEYAKDLLGLGSQFFIIQLAAIFLFGTSNILLTRFFGPEEVTAYNIAHKYFTTSTMLFAIIVTPFWSAITEAYTKKEFNWIRNSIRKLEYLSYMFIALSIVMFFAADKVYLLWVGPDVFVSKSISLAVLFFVVIKLFGTTSNTFINATGKIRLQLISAFITILITVPLAYMFCKVLNFGPEGVVYAILCTTLPTAILWKVQYKKIIGNTANGIWFK